MTHLIENLDRDKFRPLAIVPEPGPLSEKLESIGCRTFFVPLVSIKPKNFLKIWSIPRKIRKIIRENDVDILHPDYMSDVYFSHRARKGTKTKLIWHVRWNMKYAKDKFFENLPDGIIGVSEASIARFSDTPEIRSKCVVIYNGVDCEIFAPVEDKKARRKSLGLPTDKFILLFVGVFKEGKGVYELADAMPILREKYDKEKTPLLVFVGTPPNEECLQKLKDKLDSRGLGDFYWIVPQQEKIWLWMQAADALAIPSHEGNEGMPRVLYEAMACGAAGIGSDTSGVREAVAGGSGLLVKENSPESIVQKVSALIDDPNLLEELQERGRKRALADFDVKKHARKVEEFYLEILKR